MSGLNWQRRWDPFRDFQREVGRIFENFEPLQNLRTPRAFPAINLYDSGEQYTLTAELPGVVPEDIDLAITGDVLTLRGERKRPEGISDESYRRQERAFGRWARSISLPERVDATQVTAGYTNGILTVTLPKAEVAKPRHISVTSGT